MSVEYWSLAMNVISVPTAMFFAWKSHSLSREQSAQVRREELSIVRTQLGRISAIEYTSKAGKYHYGALINDGILTAEIVNQIVSKCSKYNISQQELTRFEQTANSALTNKTWTRLPASLLVKSAEDLSNAIESMG